MNKSTKQEAMLLKDRTKKAACNCPDEKLKYYLKYLYTELQLYAEFDVRPKEYSLSALIDAARRIPDPDSQEFKQWVATNAKRKTMQFLM